MARPKAFDQETVLSKAMEVFWEKGYEATSMQDLVAAMGIHRGSLYDTFQDKRHLFLAAIAYYNTTVTKAAIAPLQAPGASRSVIEQHIIAFAEQAATDPHRRGCLMTNSIIELATQDPEVAIALRRSLRSVEDAFYRALGRAQDNGEISPDKDIRALAQYLTSSLQGLRVMSKVNPDREALRQTAQLILQVLD
ncbi:MAG: TetR/AcrR family transcriptional regulator [Leptolyngbya sp. SIO1E4]|nr:TetR/AcrR family transcriptional regulator [Leptolyngbya sp. SIO1E4]